LKRGRLVYATCSVFRDENEEIIAALLGKRDDFRNLDCRDLLTQQGIDVET
jgi:16S rRNA C967 or C1407 C5-methylase (RsmB/RsmF family)